MPNEALPFHKWDKHFIEYAEKRWTKFPIGRTPRANTQAGRVFESIKKCKCGTANMFTMKNESCACTYHTRVEKLQQIKQATVNSNTSSSDASRPLSHKKGLLPKVLEKLPLLKAKNSIDEISALDEVHINRASKYKLDNAISFLLKMSNGQMHCYICDLS